MTFADSPACLVVIAGMLRTGICWESSRAPTAEYRARPYSQRDHTRCVELGRDGTLDAIGIVAATTTRRSEAGPETVMVNIGHDVTWSIVQLGLTSGTTPAAFKLEEGPDYLNQPVGGGP
jgi:hypothetical protein